ncbi:hypothetical protein ACGFIW_23635 [Micromonospora sp. NPDC048935]|uniref:hypothetical protein n=1 Tax=Micromonospora sp. NPDC048935 TaxID=3364262 RepID=UPI00370FB3F3
MGPITGFRIVNLRVEDKVAYLDLAVDLGRGGHVVIGLENGGGKSTLLGFLIHVLLPHKSQFLPRLSLRRQGMQGEEKRVEHYVPGGDPTHVVLEVEVAQPDNPFGAHRKVLIGVCLFKPANSGPDTRAEEFFWSAHSTTTDLSLRGVGLRDDDGALKDARQCQAWLRQQRTLHPDAEILVTSDQGDWGRHLRNNLRIDVDFVRTWLLAMNQDEGAADHVFTYASPRAFLNSLVSAVANPDLVGKLKDGLTRMGVDADNYALDRRRQTLLTDLVSHTEALSVLVAELDGHDERRGELLDALLAAGERLRRIQSADEAMSAAVRDRHQHAVQTRGQANRDHELAQVRQILGQLQLDRAQVAETEQRLADERALLAQTRQSAEVAEVAAQIARQRAIESRVFDLQHTLTALAEQSEPSRRVAASAAQAWRLRVTADLDAATERHTQAKRVQKAARDGQEQAREELAAAADVIARATTRADAVDTLLREIAQRRQQAIAEGLLPSGRAATDVSDEAAREVQELRRAIQEAEARQEQFANAVDETREQERALVAELTHAEADIDKATEAVQRLVVATRDLAEDLTASGLVDLDPVVLDDHVELVLDMTQRAAERANAQQLQAALAAAAAERAAQSLETRGLLPARPDIAELCAEMLTHRWGARPGWDYLTTLPSDTATLYALAHPALADGVVVNVPADLDKVIDHVRRHRDRLNGPVVIGTQDDFGATPEAGAVTVVLPDDAFWSTQAAHEQAQTRREDHELQQRNVASHRQRNDLAVQLQGRVRAWRSDIGPGAISRGERDLEQRQTDAAAIRARLTDLGAHLSKLRQHHDAATAEGQTLNRRLTDAAERRRRLEPLTADETQTAALRAEAAQLATDLDAARKAQQAPGEALAAARLQEASAAETAGRLDRLIGQLGSEKADASAMCQTLVQTGDEIGDDDLDIDRDSLAQRTRDAVERWKGLLPDAQLRAQLEQLQSEGHRIATELETASGDREQASRLVAEQPTHTPADFTADARQARDALPTISARVGGLEQTLAQQTQRASETQERYKRRDVHALLTGEDSASNTLEATLVLDRLTLQAARAAETAQHAAAQEQQLTAQLDTFRARQSLIATTDGELRALLVSLTAAGPLIDGIDQEERTFELDVETVIATAPHPVRDLLDVLQRREPDAPSHDTVRPPLNALTATVDDLRRKLAGAQDRTEKRLSHLSKTLDAATDDLLTGERVVRMLRHERGRALARTAVRHHHDLVGRRDSVAHHVARFNDRIEGQAKIAFGLVENLRRSVIKTVEDSILPTTPAMGRWSGLPLLKLTGLTSMTADQREAAILTTMQRWFDPDLPTRRAFDADETIFELMQAITPRFTAMILVPSDPLSAEHKPVEKLARQTSGGEGVTVALILASLLASRRAAAYGYRRTTLFLDNPFAKLNKSFFLRLARDVATSLNVSLISLSGTRDPQPLGVFPNIVQLRVSRRSTANIVVPGGVTDDRLQELLLQGALYASPVERDAAASDTDDSDAWPVISAAALGFDEQLSLDLADTSAGHAQDQDPDEFSEVA